MLGPSFKATYDITNSNEGIYIFLGNTIYSSNGSYGPDPCSRENVRTYQGYVMMPDISRLPL